MPDPIPVVLLGRLAVDRRHQGRRIGRALLQDAVFRARRIADEIGVRGLMVHALDDRAAAFYEGFGFQPCPGSPLTLILSLRFDGASG